MFDNNENAQIQVAQIVEREIKNLEKAPIEGIEVKFDVKTPLNIDAVFDGPNKTPYQGGKFNVKIIIHENYPNVVPKAYCITKIFHPDINTDGEINLKYLSWSEDSEIENVLLAIKTMLLLKPTASGAVNEEAKQLIENDRDKFLIMAKMYTDLFAKPKTFLNGIPKLSGLADWFAKLFIKDKND